MENKRLSLEGTWLSLGGVPYGIRRRKPIKIVALSGRIRRPFKPFPPDGIIRHEEPGVKKLEKIRNVKTKNC